MEKPARGITVMELLVAMAIAAILVAAGIPSFQTYSANQQVRAVAAEFQTTLQQARSRAISHNDRTVVCPGQPDTGCGPTGLWSDGWFSFSDRNGDREWQDTESLLQVAQAIESVIVQSSNARKRLRFFSNGSAPGSNATISLCHPGTLRTREIKISANGRIRQIRNDRGASSCGVK